MFLDLMMPETNGLEFLGKVRNELGRNINVVIITAKKTMEEVVIAKKLGIIDYITKPFTPERILKPLQAAAPESKTQQAGTAGN
jgi:DNA-binding response OmpR family regulator